MHALLLGVLADAFSEASPGEPGHEGAGALNVFDCPARIDGAFAGHTLQAKPAAALSAHAQGRAYL